MKRTVAIITALLLTVTLVACGTTNVISNGYTLYVNGTALTGTN